MTDKKGLQSLLIAYQIDWVGPAPLPLLLFCRHGNDEGLFEIGNFDAEAFLIVLDVGDLRAVTTREPA